MKAPIITNEKIETNVTDEVMSLGYKLGIALCSVIGVWAVSCLLAGVVKFGAASLVKGYITAITGL